MWEFVAFYSNFITTGKVVTYFDLAANHAWVTQLEGNPCWYLGNPFIDACGFDLSGAILNTIYGSLVAKVSYLPSNLFEFAQATYANIWQAGLSTRGWIYVPTACQSNPGVCKLHVVFHGCRQYYDLIGNKFITEIGMNDWAETNSIIILYPQTTGASNNREGCWDYWGYTGSDFAVRTGLQMAAVWTMAQNYAVIAKSVV